MPELALKEFLTTRTQSEVAEALGVKQSAVSQMVRNGRDIRVVTDESGAIVNAFEVKPVGSQPKAA